MLQKNICNTVGNSHMFFSVMLAIINISCADVAQYSHVKRHTGSHSKMVNIPAFCSGCPKFNFQPRVLAVLIDIAHNFHEFNM